MVKVKVCLVFPRFEYISGDPPMGVGYLASYLKKNTESDVYIIDTTFARSFNFVLEKLREYKPDIVGIYTDVVMTKDAIAIADLAKGKNIFTILGGPQATVLPEAFIEHADIIVQGEGELIFAKLIGSFGEKDLSHIAGIWWKKGKEVVRNPPNHDFVNLDSMPFPLREPLPMDKYLYYWNYLDVLDIQKGGTTMMVSRGCPYSCSYCQPALKKMFGERLRLRSPGNVIEEIKTLQERYHINRIFFHDDTFTIDHSWLKEFCKSLEYERISILWGCNSRIDTVNKNILTMMYQSGLRKIHFGIESASQRILDDIYNKKVKIDTAKEILFLAKKIGIYTMGFFMLGAPTETIKEINNTIAFANTLGLDEASFSFVTPLAGTYLNDRGSNGNDAMYKIHERLNYYSRYSIKGGLKRRQVKFFQLKAFVLFYLYPFRLIYVIKHLFSARGIKKLLTKIRRTI